MIIYKVDSLGLVVHRLELFKASYISMGQDDHHLNWDIFGAGALKAISGH